MELLDLRDCRDEALLNRVYQQLYLSCFADPDEQEDLEQYRERLFDPQKPVPQPETHFLVAGENLSNPRDSVLLGLMIFELYRTSACGLLTYIAVSPLARGQGLGRLLLQRAIDILSKSCPEPPGLRAIFAETHDPAKIDPANDAMSPHDRIRVMKRLGAKLVPVRYVQPALRPGDGRSRKLLLISFALDSAPEGQVAGVAVTDFMHEFYRALGVANPDADSDYLQIEADTRQAIAGQINNQMSSLAEELEMDTLKLT